MMMATSTGPTVVGCILDVSGSMYKSLETGQGDKRAVERLIELKMISPAPHNAIPVTFPQETLLD